LCIRAFSTHFGCILYFTTLKSIFSIIHAHFYITTHIPFSTLQYIILKYYKIILFLYFFFSVQPNQRHPSKPQEPINHNLNNPINSPDQQPTHASSTTATTHNPHTHTGKPHHNPFPSKSIKSPTRPNHNHATQPSRRRASVRPSQYGGSSIAASHARLSSDLHMRVLLREDRHRHSHRATVICSSMRSWTVRRNKKSRERGGQSRERASVPREKGRKEENKKRGERREEREDRIKN
jgi:hypothetical protein